MHDMSTVSKLSDKELADLIRNIDRRIGCIYNNDTLYNMMYDQKQIMIDEQYERQQAQMMGFSMPIIDTSLPYEDKDKK